MTTETQSLSEEQQTLFDHVADVIKGVLYISFMEDLDDYGIETIEQFEDAFAGQYDGYGSQSPEAQFTEELITDCGYIGNDLPPFISNHINYQEIWDCELCHDYCIIESNGSSYFFSRHF